MSVMTEQQPVETEAEDEKRGGKKKLMILVLLLVLAAVAWFLFLRPSPPSAPKPGEVVALEPIQVNLADGHYLRLGLALQLTDGTAKVDGSKALDLSIDLFTGTSADRLAQPAYRGQLKKRLEARLEKSYDGEVMGVYFTDFVTQ
jgi:flagellar FliL protein